MGYDATYWSDYVAVLGDVSGALTGLLFVAVSINSRVLGESQALRSRAAQSLCLFMTTVMIAIVIAAPQSRAALGWEFIGLAVCSALAMLVLGRRAGHATDRGVAQAIERYSPTASTPALVLIAGVTLLAHGGGGLYWLLLATVVGLVGGVMSAWLFLVAV